MLSLYFNFSLDILPENIDVNIHPTKHEVHFLHEDRILQKISEAIEKAMLGSNTSRTFYVQVCISTLRRKAPISNFDFLPQPLLPSSSTTSIADASSSTTVQKVYDHQLVRTDNKEQKLDAFITSNKLDVSVESTADENT